MQLRKEIKNDDNPEITRTEHMQYIHVHAILKFNTVVNWTLFATDNLLDRYSIVLMARSDVIFCRAELVIRFQYKGIFRCDAKAFSKRQVFLYYLQ